MKKVDVMKKSCSEVTTHSHALITRIWPSDLFINIFSSFFCMFVCLHAWSHYIFAKWFKWEFKLIKLMCVYLCVPHLLSTHMDGGQGVVSRSTYISWACSGLTSSRSVGGGKYMSMVYTCTHIYCEKIWVCLRLGVGAKDLCWHLEVNKEAVREVDRNLTKHGYVGISEDSCMFSRNFYWFHALQSTTYSWLSEIVLQMDPWMKSVYNKIFISHRIDELMAAFSHMDCILDTSRTGVRFTWLSYLCWKIYLCKKCTSLHRKWYIYCFCLMEAVAEWSSSSVRQFEPWVRHWTPHCLWCVPHQCVNVIIALSL